MSSKIRNWLYGWLGKKKFGLPTYKVTLLTTDDRTLRYRCELTVTGQSHVGVGISTNKKDAANSAAQDFIRFLIQQNLIDSWEIPDDSDFVSKNEIMESTSFDIPKGDKDAGNTSLMNEGTDTSLRKSVDLPSRMWTEDECYPDLRLDSTSLSHSAHVSTDGTHGGWTVNNSLTSLNAFLQKIKHPPLDYNIASFGSENERTFVVNVTIFVPNVQRSFSAEAKGSTKKAAKAICALSLLQQLFDNHLIDSSDSKKNKSSVKNLPKIPVNVSDKISREIMEYLKLVGVNEARLPSSLSEPVSLLITQKLNHFETSDLVSESCVLWSPALPNWNPWKSVSIDETPLASMSLEEISTALLDQEKKKFVQPHIKAQRRSLPVFQFRSHLIDTIGNNQITLIKGETGCGKSTQVCQYLLENYLENGRGSEFAAFITQPRKLSATTLAERVAVERGEDLGKSVGYSVRFDSFPPRPYGSMMFVTVGVLLKRLEFGLCGISHVIVDEIHERDINTDVILIILRDMMKIYPDLRVVLMSASIDTKIFTNYFDGCGVVVIEGRRFPVQYYFLEDIIQMIQFSPSTSKSKKKQKYECDEDGQEPTEEVQNLNLISGDEYNSNTKLAMSLLSEREIPFELIEALLIDIAKEGEKGAVLIFLPSWSAIQCMLNILRAHSLFGDKLRFAILPLHSRLAKQEQHKVFDHYSADVRKIILSTNIAETSVTIDDIVYVIDSCKTREKVYTSHNNMVHYVTDWSSRTNVIQRRGRAGRLREGFCFHLCSKSRFAALEEHQKPEILKIPLHEIALSIKLIGLGSVGDFLAKAIEAPPVSSVIEAERLLQEMSALDASNELTPLGRLLAKLPVEPVFGKTLILATVLGVGDLFATLSAASSLAAPYVVHCGASSISSQHRTFAGTRFSDHVALLCIYDKWRKMKSVMAEKDFCERLSLSSAVLKMISNVRRQMIDILISSGFHNSLFMPVDICSQGYDKNIDLVLSLLVYALYPNIGHLRDERRVFTLEKTTALISKHSVNTSLDSTNTIKFPSPLFVFSEKIRTNIISCNQISNITPIQLLLFGGCKVEYHGDNIIKLDNIISLEMDVQAASRIVALRPCIEALVVKACLNPQACSSLPENSDSKLIALLEKLSSNFGWSSHPQEKLDEAQQICGSVETISRTNCMREDRNSAGMTKLGAIESKRIKGTPYSLRNDAVKGCKSLLKNHERINNNGSPPKFKFQRHYSESYRVKPAIHRIRHRFGCKNICKRNVINKTKYSSNLSIAENNASVVSTYNSNLGSSHPSFHIVGRKYVKARGKKYSLPVRPKRPRADSSGLSHSNNSKFIASS